MTVQLWEEKVSIPTYPVGEPEKHPMFFEDRVYQGSSGRVYPNPVIEKIFSEPIERNYTAVYIENKYLKVMVLPEIGGRVHTAYDKINRRHLFYHNRVIKPALIGLLGPWISGGIEFNFPTHHRPSCFQPLDYKLVENSNGSKTVWVSEVERMQRLKGMAGFTLYPDKSYIEISVKVFNRTQFPQSFLWWANPAVHVDEHFQCIFPPDVSAVYDHGRRDVSKFPIATGEYYKWDYSEGVDISWYKNVIVPTSYMVEESDYDFVGGYDHKSGAGVVHVANHHLAPGKKFFSWGISDFSRAWDRQLTDDDGPYLEMMSGISSNNQPDFSWLNPGEEKSCAQYYLPYKDLRAIHNTSINAGVSLEVRDGRAVVQVYVTAEHDKLTVSLRGIRREYFSLQCPLDPSNTFSYSVALDPDESEKDLRVDVRAADGTELVAYSPGDPARRPMLSAAQPPLPPDRVTSNEQLFLIALHLEQYKHATIEAQPYYLEALKRDPEDIRCNNGYGLWLLRRGFFAESEQHFRKAAARLTQFNPNPYDTEPFYHLGLALKYQGRSREAYKMFYKSVWTPALQDMGYFSLAQLDVEQGHATQALHHLEHCLGRNSHNHKALHLKAVVLRQLGRAQEALRVTDEALAFDPFNFGASFEKFLTLYSEGDSSASLELADLKKQIRNNAQNYLEYAFDYMQAGLYKEASELLMVYTGDNTNGHVYPLVWYTLGFCHDQRGLQRDALDCYRRARSEKPDLCFPHQLEAIAVLKAAMQADPQDSKAPYYLANLLYDKGHVDEAIELWEESANLDPTFTSSRRNLSLAYHNKRQNSCKALEYLESAHNLDPADQRIIKELDQLYKKTGRSARERIDFLEKHPDALNFRDDLYLELVTLHNTVANYARALSMLENRNFHPWEASEGKVGLQWMLCQRELARQSIADGRHEQAIALLEAADGAFPDRLGEGKLPNTYENDIHYFLGLAYEHKGDEANASGYFTMASEGVKELGQAIFYNDQPAEKLFYQGLANRKLGREAAAQSCFNRLYDYGEAHAKDDVSIDFFALQLAETHIFTDDLSAQNRAFCHFLMGLGRLGQARKTEARVLLETALTINPWHQEASIHLRLC